VGKVDNPTGEGVCTQPLNEEEKYILIEKIMLNCKWTNGYAKGARDQVLAIIRAIITGRKVRFTTGSRVLVALRKKDHTTYQHIMTQYVILHHNRSDKWTYARKKETGELGFRWFEP
jgi:hypothetical protein